MKPACARVRCGVGSFPAPGSCAGTQLVVSRGGPAGGNPIDRSTDRPTSVRAGSGSWAGARPARVRGGGGPAAARAHLRGEPSRAEPSYTGWRWVRACFLSREKPGPAGDGDVLHRRSVHGRVRQGVQHPSSTVNVLHHPTTTALPFLQLSLSLTHTLR